MPGSHVLQDPSRGRRDYLQQVERRLALSTVTTNCTWVGGVWTLLISIPMCTTKEVSEER